MQLLEDGVPVKERGKTRSRGRIREIMILKAPVYDQDQIVGLIGFFMDITNTSKQITTAWKTRPHRKRRPDQSEEPTQFCPGLQLPYRQANPGHDAGRGPL
ncbi:hypothetical protein [Lactobacillus delbrueckii]|uniref:hypothetical protein n=1 Tax=Lactobacillus delbrueckii TaxID=1584 RepID=UPI00005105F6|nr:hypothetical protein [Lactobacillus delbrueckii]ABJ59342.1 hypothetical protein LBUL_1946 [Lactobacillus delbrueckii subsp. bulgaricus ATCC BAA-365]MBT8938351.1 hypothetical protein [Lactobacillus delbrueckii subsp. bulgaricus]